LRLLVLTNGYYGKRILENIRIYSPKDWIIKEFELTTNLPILIEEPRDFLEDLKIEGTWDLILFMGESQSAYSLLPSIAEKLQVGAVIAPIDDYKWLPIGLELQVKSELEKLGVRAVFPRTFCTLLPIGIPKIDEFAEYFGLPNLKVESDKEKVTCVYVIRGAPCGSTHFMANKLIMTKIKDANARAGTLVQIFPCLASRQIDRYFNDAPIHIAAHIAEKAIQKALK
jgi:hypothetical protein